MCSYVVVSNGLRIGVCNEILQKWLAMGHPTQHVRAGKLK